MVVRIVSGLLLVGACGAVWSLYPKRSTADRILPYIEVDLGDLPAGGDVENVVDIPNPTRNPLTVKSLLVDCSCLSKRIEPRVIPPGQSAKLIVNYKAAPTPGPVSRRIDVSYEEVNTVTTVALKGVIAGWLTEAPRTLDFGPVLAGRTAVRQFQIRTQDPWPDDQRNLDLHFDDASLQIVPQSDSRSDQFTIAVTFASKPDAPLGKRLGELSIRWDGMKDRLIRLPCTAQIVAPWKPTPATAVFGVVSADDSPEIVIRLERHQESDVYSSSELRVEHNLKDLLSAELKPVSDDRAEIVLTLSSPSESAREGVVEGQVNVLRGEDNSVVSIPIHAYLKQRAK